MAAPAAVDAAVAMPAAVAAAVAAAVVNGDAVYVLALHDDYWYVGWSTNVVTRIAAHWAGTAGVEFTRLHPPLRLEAVHPCAGFPEMEDAIVKQRMRLHGRDRVRGGAYANAVLLPEQHAALDAELRGVAGCCHACGGADHWVRACPKRPRVDDSPLVRQAGLPIVRGGSSGGDGRADGTAERPQVAPQAASEMCNYCGTDEHWCPDCPYAGRGAGLGGAPQTQQLLPPRVDSPLPPSSIEAAGLAVAAATADGRRCALCGATRHGAGRQAGVSATAAVSGSAVRPATVDSDDATCNCVDDVAATLSATLTISVSPTAARASGAGDEAVAEAEAEAEAAVRSPRVDPRHARGTVHAGGDGDADAACWDVRVQ